jgi:hypothetical protein
MRVRRAAWTHSAIIPCLKKLILCVGRLLRARSREASEEAKFACTRTPVSSCSAASQGRCSSLRFGYRV